MEDKEIIIGNENDKKFFVTPEIVNEWLKWFSAQGYSVDSSENYYSVLKRFVGYGLEINQKKVDKFRENNKSCVSSSALKSLFKFLVYKKEFPNELLNIRFERNKQVRKLPRTISHEEIKILIDSMPDMKNKVMTELMYEFGLRISSVLKLTWNDFNWFEWLLNKEEWGKVNIVGAKRDKFGVLPVKPEIMKTLYDACPNKSSSGVPIGNNIFDIGNAIKSFMERKEYKPSKNIHDYLDYAKRTYRNTLYRISKEKLGKRINPHVLRHSKAQHLLDSGVPIETIKEILLHSDLSTTQIYAKSSPEKIKKDLQQYDTNNSG